MPSEELRRPITEIPASPYRKPIQVAAYVVGQELDRCITSFGLLAQRCEHNVVQVSRQSSFQGAPAGVLSRTLINAIDGLARLFRLLMTDDVVDLLQRLSVQRVGTKARQELVEQHTK